MTANKHAAIAVFFVFTRTDAITVDAVEAIMRGSVWRMPCQCCCALWPANSQRFLYGNEYLGYRKVTDSKGSTDRADKQKIHDCWALASSTEAYRPGTGSTETITCKGSFKQRTNFPSTKNVPLRSTDGLGCLTNRRGRGAPEQRSE